MSKRDVVLESAATLFINKGYKNLTMDEIADYVGITKKTLYNHFPGKFELMKEAIELKLDTILLELKKITANQNEYFTSKLKRLIRFATHAFSQRFSSFKIICRKRYYTKYYISGNQQSYYRNLTKHSKRRSRIRNLEK